MASSATPAQKEKIGFRSPLARFRRRRTHSAPPRFRRREGTMLKEHFRVDPVKRVVLPGIPKHADDWAREAHDLFNLVVLVRARYSFLWFSELSLTLSSLAVSNVTFEMFPF